MKEYIKPNTTVVNLHLVGSILEGETIAGQSNNPVGKPENPDDVEWSAKKQGFLDDGADEGWAKNHNPWGN